MTKPPSTAFIRAVRANFRMDVREFEQALGYSTDGRIGIALESGTRNGWPFELTGPAAKALSYLTAAVQAYDLLQTGDYGAAEATLRLVLPARLQ